MSLFWFFRFRTAELYDFAVIAPLMLRSALTANFASRKPIWANACGAIFVYFWRIWNISAESGPTFGSMFENSLSIQRWPSNAGENWPDMNVFAIGVDDPHITLSTIPWAWAAFMNAGAVSGVKSSRMPPPLPANWYICRSCEVASVTGRCVGEMLTGMLCDLAPSVGP